MQRLVYSEYSGLNYPDDSWSGRAHRLLRALWIIAVAATIGGIGGGSVALALLHFTGGSSRQENAGVAVKPQSVPHPAAARLPRIAATPAATISAAAPTVSATATTATAPPAAVSPAAPTATVRPKAVSATAPPAADSAAAPTATAPPAAVSAAAPTATAPPAAVSAAAPTTPPAAVSAAAPTTIAPPAAVKLAPASAVPATPSPSNPADLQTRIASAPAATEPGDDAAASTPDHAPARPRALAHVGRHATRLSRPDRYALAENARSHPRSHYDSAYDRHHHAYVEARRSRYPQNGAYDDGGGGGYWRGGRWGGGGYWRPGGWGGGGGDWGD